MTKFFLLTFALTILALGGLSMFRNSHRFDDGAAAAAPLPKMELAQPGHFQTATFGLG
jgi:hypothetical protein